MKPRTEQITRLLRKSTRAELTIPSDFLNSELIDSTLADDLKDAITQLKNDSELEITEQTSTDEYIITITLKTEENTEEPTLNEP